MQLDWEVISAISDIISAFATFLATVTALYFGLRPYRKRLEAYSIFDEAEECRQCRFVEDCPHPDWGRRFGFDVINTGSQTIRLNCVVLEGRVRRSASCAAHFLDGLIKERTTILSPYGNFKIEYPKTGYVIPFDGCKIVEPGEQLQLRLPFLLFKDCELQRQHSGWFDMDGQMKVWLVDSTGKRYRVNTVITPNSFVEKRQCRMVKRGLFDCRRSC